MPDERYLDLVRRNIIKGIARRLQQMQFGFAFTVRGQHGLIENANLQPFATLEACEEAAANAAYLSERPKHVKVVPCHYDQEGCYPRIMTILRSFRRRTVDPPN